MTFSDSAMLAAAALSASRPFQRLRRVGGDVGELPFGVLLLALRGLDRVHPLREEVRIQRRRISRRLDLPRKLGERRRLTWTSLMWNCAFFSASFCR
jgi:hypothetical protein